MIEIKIKGLEEAVADIKELRHKIPSIMARTLTETAKDAKRDVEGWLPRMLDRPTPWTMRSLFVFPAEKTDMRAAVAFKHEGGRYGRHNMDRVGFGQANAPRAIRSQVYGGQRQLKSSESKLRSSGILPQGKFMVPAVGAPKDRFGNVRGSFVTKVLYTNVAGGTGGSSGTPVPLQGTARRRSRNTDRYFVKYLQPSIRRGALGIYRDMGKGKPPLPVFLFVDSANYRSRVPFENIVRGSVDRNWRRRFDESVRIVAAKYLT